MAAPPLGHGISNPQATPYTGLIGLYGLGIGTLVFVKPNDGSLFADISPVGSIPGTIGSPQYLAFDNLASTQNTSYFYTIAIGTIYKISLSNILGLQSISVTKGKTIRLSSNYAATSIGLAFLNRQLYVLSLSHVDQKFYFFKVDPTTGITTLASRLPLIALADIPPQEPLPTLTAGTWNGVTSVFANAYSNLSYLFQFNFSSSVFNSLGPILYSGGDLGADMMALQSSSKFWFLNNAHMVLARDDRSSNLTNREYGITPGLTGLCWGTVPWGG